MKNPQENENGQAEHQPQENRQSALKKIVFKAILITLISVTVVTATGALMYKSIVKPPEIPVMAMENEPPEPGLEPAKPPTHTPAPPEAHEADAAFYTPEAEEPYEVDPPKAPEGFTSEDRKEQFYTFLVFGLDAGFNTDTIIVASYDGLNREANVISIPRDTKVNVRRSLKKINGAYPSAMYKSDVHEDGVAQLKREVKTIIGFEPDFSICVDLDAFEKVVDAVGGVDIFVPWDMKYDDPVQDLHIDIRKGQQHLNGHNALRFSRYRKGNARGTAISDFDRINNQQTVIMAVADKLLRPSNLLKINKFIDIFNQYVKSDLDPENILWFAAQLNHIKGTEALALHTMPIRVDSGNPPEYYEYLDERALLALINSTINPFNKNIRASDLDIVRN